MFIKLHEINRLFLIRSQFYQAIVNALYSNFSAELFPDTGNLIFISFFAIIITKSKCKVTEVLHCTILYFQHLYR